MEAFGALGFLIATVVGLVILVLALLMPYFIYSIHRTVQLIHQDLQKLTIRDHPHP